MAIINSYPSITVTPSDLLLVSDVSEEGNPTKTTSVQSILDLAASGAGFVTSIVAGDGLAVDQSTGIVTISANLSVSSGIPGLTFTNSPQGTLNIGISGTPLATQFLNGTGNWSTPAGGGGGGMTSWNITADNLITSVVSENNTVDIDGGSKISTVNIAGTVTVNHDTTTTTPTTSASSPAAGGTFDAIDSITYDATGHITGFNTNTVTLPAAGGGGSTSITASNSTFINGVATPSPITSSGTLAYSLSATGTPSATTFLRGDNIWATPSTSNIPTYFSVNKSGNIANSGNIADDTQGFGTITTALNASSNSIKVSFGNAQGSTDYIINFTLEEQQVDTGQNYAPRGYVATGAKNTADFTLSYVKPGSSTSLGDPVLTNFQLYK